jgi:hypothetical protein
MLAGSHYRGHDSTPSPEYIRDMQARTGGPIAKTEADDPLAKINATIARGDALVKASLAKVDALVADVEALVADTADIGRRIDQLRASADPYSDQRGRPEHMSPTEWARRAK